MNSFWAGLQIMRPSQWSKNTLLFVPVVAGQKWLDWSYLGPTIVAFASLSACASATYIVNDLTDIASDRAHPRKRFRPLAAGTLSPIAALALMALLLVLSYASALSVGWHVALGILIYMTATLAYSFLFKQKMLIDVLVLAGLYTYRILLGGTASRVAISHWLLLFSAFLFVSLALAKRFAELNSEVSRQALNPRRGYRANDLPLINSLGISSGAMAILVFSFYVTGETAKQLYRTPAYLWLAAPALFYWICRLWFLAQRSQLCEDPLVFTFKDRISYYVGVWVILAFLLAEFAPRIPLFELVL